MIRATVNTVADAIGLLCLVLFALGLCSFGSVLRYAVGG